MKHGVGKNFDDGFIDKIKEEILTAPGNTGNF